MTGDSVLNFIYYIMHITNIENGTFSCFYYSYLLIYISICTGKIIIAFIFDTFLNLSVFNSKRV